MIKSILPNCVYECRHIENIVINTRNDQWTWLVLGSHLFKQETKGNNKWDEIKQNDKMFGIGTRVRVNLISVCCDKMHDG